MCVLWGYSCPTSLGYWSYFSSIHTENDSSFSILRCLPWLHRGKGRTQYPPPVLQLWLLRSSCYCAVPGTSACCWEDLGRRKAWLRTQMTRDERLPLKVFLSNQSLLKTFSWLLPSGWTWAPQERWLRYGHCVREAVCIAMQLTFATYNFWIQINQHAAVNDSKAHDNVPAESRASETGSQVAVRNSQLELCCLFSIIV